MKRFTIITYSIQGSDQSTRDNIKSLGDWFNYLPGSWIIFTDFTPKQIFEKIKTSNQTDRFLIMEIKLGQYWGRLPSAAWAWLKEKKDENLLE